MLESIPHQKFYFYHLPTRGRVGIKLGDAWYVSNVSIIFDCSMLLYYLFWMLMDLLLHFYIIFGTNRLTGGPAQIDETWSGRQATNEEATRQGARLPPGRALHPRGRLVAPPTYFFLLYISTYPQTSRSTTKTEFHCRNLLYPRDPILGPFPELRRRGHRSRRASTSTPWPLRWCVSSLLQTFGVHSY